ncbi:zinc-ribbon domain-containing protein [Salibacterium sp. K-3]
MYCSKCGMDINQDDNYCSSCGTGIGRSQVSASDDSAGGSSFPEENDQGKKYVILGWLFFAISLILIPILFGTGAFIMGFLTYKKRNQTHGVVLMIFAVVGTIIGTMIAMAVRGDLHIG